MKPDEIITALQQMCKTELGPARSVYAHAIDALAELSQDKKRLDWLADPENKIGNVALPVGAVQENLHSMRAAIDAAMSGNYTKNAPIVEGML